MRGADVKGTGNVIDELPFPPDPEDGKSARPHWISVPSGNFMLPSDSSGNLPFNSELPEKKEKKHENRIQ